MPTLYPFRQFVRTLFSASGSNILCDEAIEKLQDLEAGVIISAPPSMVTIPVANDSLFRERKKVRIIQQEHSVEPGI